MTQLVAAVLIAFVVGIIFALCLLQWSGDLVVVTGKKDSFQTVDWNGKNYRLVPLDEEKP